jgi:hypothetical protein
MTSETIDKMGAYVLCSLVFVIGLIAIVQSW